MASESNSRERESERLTDTKKVGEPESESGSFGVVCFVASFRWPFFVPAHKN